MVTMETLQSVNTCLINKISSMQNQHPILWILDISKGGDRPAVGAGSVDSSEDSDDYDAGFQAGLGAAISNPSLPSIDHHIFYHYS